MWGGGITIRRSDPPDLRQMMLRKLLTVYPQLEGVRVETAWTGLMGYPKHAMPQIGEVSPGVWYTMGFGGHGMGTTTLTGELVAAAIAGNDDRLRTSRPLRPGLDRRCGRIADGGDDLPVLPLQGLAEDVTPAVPSPHEVGRGCVAVALRPLRG